MLTKFAEWACRMNFPQASKARLGFASEYWLGDPRLYEGYEQLRDRLKQLGRKAPPRYVAGQLSGHLLSEVLAAGGGAEGALMRLRASIDKLHLWVNENQFKAEAGVPHGLGHEAAADAWYAFSEFLIWSRTLVERMERRAGNPKKFPKQGLLPALKPKRLKRNCERLFTRLQAGPVGRSRPLVNFVVHAALINHPHTGAELQPSGAIVLPVPDLPTQQVAHWYLLTWHTGQDGVALAEDMWVSIQEFLDGLLAAFEKAAPRRMRR